MHHPSWLFPGARNPRHRDSGCLIDVPANDNNGGGGPAGFEINSFVRSLNRGGIQLPENLMSQSNGSKEARKGNRENENRRDDKVRKNIDGILSILHDSADRVVGIRSENRPSSSSFENFRSANEDRDTAAWNDLIQLVSTTAHEFRSIKTSGNPLSDAPHNCSATPVRIETGSGPVMLPDFTRWSCDRSRLKASRDCGADFEAPSGERTMRKIELDVTPTNDGLRDSGRGRVHSDLCGANSARLNEKHFREVGHSRTPKHLVGEILRASGNSRDQNSPSWITCNRRINYEDDLWPAAFAVANNSDFPPYFTGGLNKSFDFRSKIAINSTRFMDASRSSPIFVDAGEAIAEPAPDILNQERVIPARCRPDAGEENRVDFRPTKLDRTTAEAENASTKSSNHEESSDTAAKLSPHLSEGKKSISSSCKSGADGKKIRRAKLVVKRGRKIGKQLRKRNARKNASETEDENDLETESMEQSPRSPVQRFIEESCKTRGGKETVPRSETENYIEGEMITVSQIQSPRAINFAEKRLRPAAKSVTSGRCNGSLTTDKNTKDLSKAGENLSLTKTRNTSSSRRLNFRCVCDKPDENPEPNAKLASSLSVPGNSGPSRFAQCATSQAPNKKIGLPLSTVENKQVPAVTTKRLENSSKCTSFETRRLQRPSTAQETSRNRVPEAQPRGRTLKPSSSREPSGDQRKFMKNYKTSASSGTNRETNIPALRSKTFVHPIRRESSIRCVAVKADCSTAVGERPSSKSMLNSPACSGPVKQLYRKPWKNSSRVQRDADLSSETNLDDTPVDSQINTDTELSGSVSAASNSNSKNAPCGAKDSKLREKDASEILDAGNRTSSKFQNKHARSLKILKSILCHQGVNVESVNRDVKEIRSRISSDSSNKSQVPICTGRKKSSPLLRGEKNSPNTSRTLFEKLAILAEPQTEKPARPAAEAPSGKCFSSANLKSDSTVNCAESTKDDAEQCSLDYTSATISKTSMRSSKSNFSEDPQESSVEPENPATFVDASISPFTSATALSKLESSKSSEVAATQTQSNMVDKDSITDDKSQPVTNVWTETAMATREVSTDCCQRHYTASKDVSCGKDFLELTSISREVNTEAPDIFVKSRGVCFRGARKLNGSSQVTPYENSRDAACGRDYAESQGVSKLVNTDRQDYLYVDRSADVLGPRTIEDACQIEPRLSVVDAAVGESSRGPGITSGFSRIKLVEELDLSSRASLLDLDLPNHGCSSSASSRSSLVPWRGTSAGQFGTSADQVPREAILALGIVLERGENLYKAMEIHRANLAAREIRIKRETQEIHCREVEREAKTRRTTNVEHSQIARDPEANPEDDVAIIINELFNDAANVAVSQDGCGIICGIDEPKLHEDNQENRHPEIAGFDEKVKNDCKKNSVRTHKSGEFSLLSRNSLLTVVYGTVCSFVFWALQFSITCDSL